MNTLPDDIEVVELEGELDVSSAGALKQRLLEAGANGRRKLLVDLTRVDFVDSATIGALIGAATRTGPSGGEVGVICADPVILETFEIAALEQVIAIYRSREAALADLAPGASAGDR